MGTRLSQRSHVSHLAAQIRRPGDLAAEQRQYAAVRCGVVSCQAVWSTRQLSLPELSVVMCCQEDEPMTVLKRQCITDTSGNPIAVILPLAEFALVAETLEQRLTHQQTEAKLQTI